MLTIYHNSRCSKSRDALTILQESGKEFTLINYLETPPTKAELITILKKLGIPAHDLVRKTESIYKEQYTGKTLTEKQWVAAMVAYPIIIERPIVLNGERAVIARPGERVWEVME